jgi:hypothetical protein
MIPRDRPAKGKPLMDGKIDPVTKKIEEIVYEVEAGQVPPWTGTKRLVRLFRERKAADLGKKARKNSVHEVAVS